MIKEIISFWWKCWGLIPWKNNLDALSLFYLISNEMFFKNNHEFFLGMHKYDPTTIKEEKYSRITRTPKKSNKGENAYKWWNHFQIRAHVEKRYVPLTNKLIISNEKKNTRIEISKEEKLKSVVMTIINSLKSFELGFKQEPPLISSHER